VLLLYWRVGELGVALRGFRLAYLAPVLALVLVNYGLRFARWHYYLRRCGARVPWRESAAVFLSGFALSITPARVGELLKCVLLRDEAGVKMSVSVPVVVADRVNDLVAICILVAAGMLRYSAARGASLLAIAAVAALVAVLAFSPWIADGATRLFARRFAKQSASPRRVSARDRCCGGTRRGARFLAVDRRGGHPALCEALREAERYAGGGRP